MSLQPGFVLHRRAYTETSLLIEVFTATAGRLPLVAKGVYRARAPRVALLQLFQPLWLDWRGRGEVKTLTHAEAAGMPWPLRGERLYCGFYLNELLLRLLGREEPAPALFAAYWRALERLTDCATPPDAGLRQFELALLRALGYELTLECTAIDGAPVQPKERYRFVNEAGLYPVTTEDGHHGAVTGDTLHRLARDLPLDARHRREARHLLRQALAPYLGPQPLRSRALFRAAARDTHAERNEASGEASA